MSKDNNKVVEEVVSSKELDVQNELPESESRSSTGTLQVGSSTGPAVRSGTVHLVALTLLESIVSSASSINER